MKKPSAFFNDMVGEKSLIRKQWLLGTVEAAWMYSGAVIAIVLEIPDRLACAKQIT